MILQRKNSKLPEEQETKAGSKASSCKRAIKIEVRLFDLLSICKL
jgi:hypothetical protein